MARVKNLLRLLFVLGAGWIVLKPVIYTAPADPVAWIGPGLVAVVVIYVGNAIAEAIAE